jgi:hypothetical protein
MDASIFFTAAMIRVFRHESLQQFLTTDHEVHVRFPALPWGFFLEGEASHGDHGLDSLVELRFQSPPGTPYSYITIHLIGTT